MGAGPPEQLQLGEIERRFLIVGMEREHKTSPNPVAPSTSIVLNGGLTVPAASGISTKADLAPQMSTP